MKERPILFSGPMVKAILDGKKTMTRRVIKKQPLDILPMNVPNQWCALDEWGEDGNKGSIRACRFGVPGDQLWVRETWDFRDWRDVMHANRVRVAYAADGQQKDFDTPAHWRPTIYNSARWRPSIHMPRWASRITLEITDVRVERLQEISVEDCQREGISDSAMGGKVQEGYVPQTAFSDLWDSINGKKYPWDSNPFCWVISFKHIA